KHRSHRRAAPDPAKRTSQRPRNSPDFRSIENVSARRCSRGSSTVAAFPDQHYQMVWNCSRSIVFACRSRHQDGAFAKESRMLYWAVVFFVIAIIAAIFGFGGIASAAAGIAKILFFIFIVIFAIALIMGLMRGRGPTV